MKLFSRLAVGIVLTTVLFSGHVLAQGGDEQVQIRHLDISAFPSVTLSFRVHDGNGNVVRGLTANTISLLENGIPVEALSLSTAQDMPQMLVFIIDTGFASPETNDEVSDLLEAAASALREGVDTVTVLEHRDSQPGWLLFGPESNLMRFREWIQNYQRERTISNRIPLQSLELAIEQIETLNLSGQSASAILYIGQLIEFPLQGDFGRTLTQLHQRAARMGTPIYSFNLGVGNDENIQRVNEIASSQGGRFSLSDGQDANLLFQDFYEQLSEQRLTYDAHYSASSVDLNTDRYTVTLQINQAIDTESTNLPVDPPVVTIVSPSPGETIVREAHLLPENGDEPLWAFDLSNVSIQALIDFPDSIDRDIVSAQLLVDGTPTLALSGTTSLSFVWDISHLIERGSYPHTLQVSAMDAFGIVSSSPSQVLNVSVNIPDGVATVTVEETVVVRTACEQNVNSADCVQQRFGEIAPWIGVFGLALVIVWQRQRIAVGAAAVGAQAVRIATTVRDSVIKVKTEPYAEIHVLKAALREGSTFQMHGRQIIFGRDPSQTDVQLYPLEQPANERVKECSISGRHCTIEYDIANQQFTITDHSRFGTFVKRVGTSEPEQLKNDIPTQLHDSDEIILGRMNANGARLSFKTTNNSRNAIRQGRIPTNVNENPLPNGRIPTDVNEPAISGRVPTMVGDDPTTSPTTRDQAEETVVEQSGTEPPARFATKRKKLSKL